MSLSPCAGKVLDGRVRTACSATLMGGPSPSLRDTSPRRGEKQAAGDRKGRPYEENGEEATEGRPYDPSGSLPRRRGGLWPPQPSSCRKAPAAKASLQPRRQADAAAPPEGEPRMAARETLIPT